MGLTVDEPPGGAALRKALPGGMVLLVGLAVTIVLVGSLAADVSLWLLGRRVTATVVDQWVERIGEQDGRELAFRYFVHEFTTSSGQVVAKTSTLSVLEWAAPEKGGQVSVVHFPLYPAHTRLMERRFIFFLLCSYLPLALVGWAGLRGAGIFSIWPSPNRRNSLPFPAEACFWDAHPIG